MGLDDCVLTAGSTQKHFKSDIMVAKRRTFETLRNLQLFIVLFFFISNVRYFCIEKGQNFVSFERFETVYLVS